MMKFGLLILWLNRINEGEDIWDVEKWKKFLDDKDWM